MPGSAHQVLILSYTRSPIPISIPVSAMGLSTIPPYHDINHLLHLLILDRPPAAR